MLEETALERLEVKSNQLVNDIFADTRKIKSVNLDSLRNILGLDAEYEDIYVINKDGIIINTTFKNDLGLNLFNFGNEHYNYLKSIWNNGNFQSAGFTVESSTNRPRLYTYQPTGDGEFLIELGLIPSSFCNDLAIIVKYGSISP